MLTLCKFYVRDIHNEIQFKKWHRCKITKTRAQIGAAVISNFNQAEKAMDTMANSAGAADAEMEIITNSLSYKLNALKETGTGIFQNLFQRDDFGAIVEGLTQIIGLVDTLTDKLGLIGTIGAGVGIGVAIKNIRQFFTEEMALQSALAQMNGMTASTPDTFFTSLAVGAKSLLPIMLKLAPAIIAVSGAIAAFYAFDKANTVWTRAQEDAEKAVDEYNKAKDSLDSLQNKQKDNMSQVQQIGAKYNVELNGVENIDEAVEKIKSSDGITLVDEAELDKIARANADVESQLNLQEQVVKAREQASILATSAASNVEKSYWEEVKDRHGKGLFGTVASVFDYLSGNNGQPVIAGKPTEKDEWKNRDTTNYGLAQKALEDYQKKREEFKNFKKDDAKSDEENAKAQRELTEEVSKSANAMTDYVDSLSAQAEILEKSSKAEDKKRAKEYRDLINDIATVDMTDAEKSLYNLQSFFDGSTASNIIKEELESAAEEGKNLEDVLSDMGLSLSDLGIDKIEDLNKYFAYAKDKIDEADEAVKNFRQSVSDVEEATKSENQDKGWSTIQSAFKSGKELLEKGQTGTDDFKSLAQFLSPDNLKKQAQEITDKVGGRGSYLASDVYQKAFEKVKKTAERWFGEDETKSMKNFVDDMDTKGLFEVDRHDENGLASIQAQFDSTAEAADKFGISVGAVETMLDALESYGYDFSKITKSGEAIEEVSTALQGLKEVRDSMGEGDERDSLDKLIKKYEKDYSTFEEDLSKLDKEYVIEIKFQYDMAQIERDIQELQGKINEGDDDLSTRAARNAKKREEIEKREEKSGYKEGTDKGYDSTDTTIQNLRGQFKEADSEKEKRDIQDQIAAVYDLQNAYQKAFAKDNSISWDEFLGTKGAEKAFQSIEEDYDITKEKMLGLTESQGDNVIKFDAELDAKDLESQVKSLEKGQTIVFDGNVDNVESEIEVFKDEEGHVTYTANIDGVKTTIYPIIQEDGTVTYTADYTKITPPPTQEVEAEVKTTTDDSGLEQPEETEQTVVRIPSNDGLVPPPEVAQKAKRVADNSAVMSIPSITQVVHRKVVGGDSGSGGAFGTAHARGTAFASGDWGTKGSGVALMGELGSEIIVRDGKWFTVGDDGAEFVHYRKNDIVFNHLQSEQLLEKGKITHGNRRGGALASGTAFALRYDNDSSTSSSSSGGTSTRKKKKTNKDSGGGKGGKDSSSKKDTAIDWIERKLTYFANKVKAIADTITDYVTSAVKESKLKQERKAVDKQLNANVKAYDAYLKKAKKVDLDSGLKKKVRKGDYNIKDYDEKTQKQINKYKEYYDNATKAQQKVTELRNEQLKLFEELMNIPTEKAQKKIKKLKNEFDALSASLKTVSSGMSGLNQLLSLDVESAEADVASAKSEASSAKKTKSKASKNLKKAKSKLTKKDKKTKKNTDGTYKLPKNKNSAEYKRLKAYNDALKKSKKANSAYNVANSNYESAQSNLSNAQSAYSLYGSGETYNYENALVDAETENLRKQNQANQQALTSANANLSSAQSASTSAKNAVTKKANDAQKNKKLGKEVKKRLKNAKGGKISTKSLKGNDLKYAKAYNSLVDKAKTKTSELKIAQEAQASTASDAAQSQAELAQQIVQAEQDKFNNIKKYYEAQNDYLESTMSKQQALNEIQEAKGITKTASDYNKLISETNNQISNLETESAKLKQQLQSSVASGVIKEGSEEWKDMQIEINNVEKSTYDLKKQQIEYNNAVANLPFETIEKYLEYLDSVSDLLEVEQSIKETRGIMLDIQDYQASVADNQKKINEYQKEYNKALEYANLASQNAEGVYGGKTAQEWQTSANKYLRSVKDLENANEELANSIAKVPFDKIEKFVDYLDSVSDITKANQELKEAMGLMLEVSDYQTSIAENNEKMAQYQEMYVKAISNVALANQDADGVYGGKSAQEWQMEANNYISTIRDMQTANQELSNSIIQIPFDKIEKVLDLLEAQTKYNDSVRKLKKASGSDYTEADYYDRIADATAKIAQYEQESYEAYSAYTQAMANADGVYGGKTADEWKAMYYDLSSNVNDLKSDIEDIRKELRDDVYWRTFERMHDAAQRAQSVISGINDLIDEGALFDKDGNMTKWGISRVGNLVKSFENARKEVDNYSNDLKNLNKLYAEGFYTQDEFNEKLAEIRSGLLDSASDMKSYQDSIVDMYKELAQTELDYLNDVIDKRQDALAKKKESKS